VECRPGEHKAHAVRSGLYKLPETIENAQHLGIDTERLADAARRDPGIGEFCRFYIERRVQEMAAAGDDVRKRKKMEDDFTPRLELTVVALEGDIHREVTTETQYSFDNSPLYASQLTVVPRTGACLSAPELGRCENTGMVAPKECLGHCVMTGADVLRHLLVPSEISGRLALRDHTLRCKLSGKCVLTDEAELSAVTGNPVASPLLKTCGLTGKRAEPEHFDRCEFTGVEVLGSELPQATSRANAIVAISNPGPLCRGRQVTATSFCFVTKPAIPSHIKRPSGVKSLESPCGQASSNDAEPRERPCCLPNLNAAPLRTIEC
jgi:hypothetical protein